MDALLAFWPGLQVLLGDVRPAVETHEMLYQVMQRHTFIPEAFTSDLQVSYINRCFHIFRWTTQKRVISTKTTFFFLIYIWGREDD